MIDSPSLLVIDDDPKVAHVLARALRRDYSVVTETEGRRALARVENGERFDVILTDLSMADLSVADLHTEIRKIDPGQADRMLFVTGGAFSKEIEIFVNALKNPRIAKPFDMKLLRRCIEQMRAQTAPEPIPSDAVAALAKKFDIEALQRDPSPTAFVDEQGAILWVNDAWLDFGTSNGAASEAIVPGQNYFGAIGGELRSWLIQVATKCLASGGTFESDYECSSTTTLREFRMRVLPVPDHGLLIIHSLRVERPHDHEPQVDPDPKHYISANGFIVMCSNCRRVRRNGDARWDWIPSWIVKAPVLVSHGLCHLCVAFYFG